MRKRRFFNMIEILLAMGVTAIGIAGLCAVLPVGLISSRHAYQSNCVCGIATEFYDRLSHWCGLYFDQVIAEEYNDSYHQQVPETSGREDQGIYYTGTASNVSTDSFYFTDQRRWIWPYMRKDSDPEIPFTDAAHTKQWSASDVFSTDKAALNIAAGGGIKSSNLTYIPGLWKFRVFNDFSGEFRIWKEIPEDIGAFDNETEKKLVRIYIEFSYPSQAAYADRTKRLFAREFYEWRAEWYPEE